MISAILAVGLIMGASAQDGARFEGTYKCPSMMGPDMLDVTLARVGDQQVVHASRFNAQEKRTYVLAKNAVVTGVKMAEGDDPKEEWTFAFQNGSLEIDVTADGSLNMIIKVGDIQRGFWPCLKSAPKSDSKS